MFELRILNGLHRGATLPLGGDTVTIGAGDEADVVMVDQGIEADHAELTPNTDGSDSWLLTATGGGVWSADQSRPQTVLELEPGAFARLGEIWLTIADEKARWEAPPAIIENDVNAMDSLDEEDSQPAASADPAQAAAAANSGSADESDADKAAAFAVHAKLAAATRRAPRRRARTVILALPFAAMLVAATAYALTSRPASSELSKEATEMAKKKAIAAGGRSGPDGTLAVTASKDSATVASAATPDALDNAALSQLFRKRLSDADLLNRFDLTLNDQNWTMQAQLDDEETARFERILANFIKEHDIHFPILAKAVTAEAMLPFKIGQVITGANPSMVTQDGERLFVGDDLRGVRVVAITQNRLTFFGKRKIEVNW